MGFFSICDAKTGVSIPAYPHAGLPKAASNIVVVFPDDSTLKGLYDGYGNVGVFELPEIVEEKKDATWVGEDWIDMIKFVRVDHYNNETFKKLKKSKRCPYQGYFYTEAAKKKIVDSLPSASLEEDKKIKNELDKKDKRMVTLKFKERKEKGDSPVAATENVLYTKIKEDEDRNKLFEKMLRKVFSIDKKQYIRLVNQKKDDFYYSVPPPNAHKLSHIDALVASKTYHIEAENYYKYAKEDALPAKKAESNFKKIVRAKYQVRIKADHEFSFKTLKEEQVGRANDMNVSLLSWSDTHLKDNPDKKKYSISCTHDHRGLLEKKGTQSLPEAEKLFETMTKKYKSA